MTGTEIDTWLSGLTWALTLLSLLGLVSVGARLLLRRLFTAGHAAPHRKRQRARSYSTVPASEQTGENLRPFGAKV
ncbi:MAG: hypothetical protein IPG17_13805 [Sandaracinaceae bacterium]|nr:hypothetical protein [Sandaracinaceae bacterium]